MKPKEFYKTVVSVLEDAFLALGFTARGSRRATFHRRGDSGVFHIVTFRILRGNEHFDILAFPSVEALDPDFRTGFPDALVVPVWQYFVNEKQGVGERQQMFACRDSETLLTSLEKVRSLLPRVSTHLALFNIPSDLGPFLANDADKALL